MNKQHKIVYLPLFYKDLDNIIDYIKFKLKNEIAANKLVNELESKINQRAFNPTSFEVYISTRKRKEKYYRIYIGNYTVFYVVENDVMEVRRILYSKSNFKKII